MMMINTINYNTFAQDVLSSRSPSERFSSHLKNAFLLGTPEGATLEFIDSLGSRNSDASGQFGSDLSQFSRDQLEQIIRGELSLEQSATPVETKRKAYVELLAIGSRDSAFGVLPDGGYAQVLMPSSQEGEDFLNQFFQTKDKSLPRKFFELAKNISYHTRLTPIQLPSVEQPSTVSDGGDEDAWASGDEEGQGSNLSDLSPSLFDIIASLRAMDSNRQAAMAS